MRKFKRLIQDVSIFVVVAICSLTGLFAPLDNALRNLRFDFTSRPASQSIVFVAIDPASLGRIGVWPWPRRTYARVIDHLIAMDASDILFDIDFSTTSNETDDALFADALERAGGFVGLSAFRQAESITSAANHYNLPLERFARNAQIADVNVRVDDDGVLRSYTKGGKLGGKLYNSAATMLSGDLPTASRFNIDFGIDVSTIDIVSVAQILDGQVDPSRIAGKQVVIGASALALRDDFAVPRYGVLPGPLVQILAAETLKQGRALIDFERQGALLLAALATLVFLLTRWRAGLAAAFVVTAATCGALEVGAYILQAGPCVLVNTTSAWVAFGGLAVMGYSRELDLRYLLLRRTARERDDTRNILDRVIADNFDGVVVVSSDGKVVAASRLAETMLGFSAEAPATGSLEIATALPPILAAEINAALERRAEPSSAPMAREGIIDDGMGGERVIEYVVTLSAVDREGNSSEEEAAVVACLTFRDVTERHATERRLGYIAAHDALTGALSRAKFSELIAESLNDGEGRKTGMTVALLDLSRFKIVNDTLGHAQGDALLKQVVERIASADVDCVARMGGDTFAAARTGILKGKALAAFCAGIIDSIAEPYHLGERRAIIGGRMGVTTTALSGFDAEVLISHADMALSAAKASPMNGFAVYDDAMDARLNEKRDMEVALRHAIENGEFFLLYQPQVDLATGRLRGVEALVRWRHPELGVVSPEKFVPVAEETGLILELGRWVLMSACREVGRWPGNVCVAVNVSPMQFEFADIVADVAQALKQSHLPAERLEVEITERLFIARPQIVNEKLNQLKSRGVQVALDDFGTGYSSLSYLDKLPVDKIKIDRAFVSGLPRDQHAGAVVRAVMTLSESLGKTVIAEGIENADQAWMLRMAGCQMGQGFYYDRPITSAEILERLAGPSYEVAQ